LAKPDGNFCRFFRPRPQGLINYLSGLDGLPVAEIEQQLNELYSVDCCDHHTALSNLAADDDFAAQMLAMLQQVWKDKGMPEGLINKEVTSQFAKRLWSGVTEGYGNAAKQFNEGKLDWETPDFNKLAALQKNTWQFSAAKNYAQMKELSNALIGEDGKLRTYNQFKEVAYSINDKHVNQWLKAEYELAVAGGQMAGKWVDIEKNIDTLPLLEFDAVMDSRTTPICSPLNGTILPVNDPFWSKYYPPNHWGCRSTVRQRAGGVVTPHHQLPHADIPPMFQTNLAKSGLIFPPGHAYFKDLPKEVLSFGDANYKLDTSRDLMNKKGKVYESGLAYNQAKQFDVRYNKEYQMRISAADALAQHFNESVFITPELSLKDYRYQYFFRNVPIPRKLPDFIIGDKYWELESYEGSFKWGKISTMLKKGAEQSDRIIMKLRHKVDIDNVIKRTNGSLYNSGKHLLNVKSVIVIDHNDKVHIIK